MSKRDGGSPNTRQLQLTGFATSSTRPAHGRPRVPVAVPIAGLLALPYADLPGYREEWRP
ncbi:DUF6221 family protein [Streptomyces sp. NPDC093228]|uniref:DUF6221 family protein n=1 Tax=unclassified Streptomyces TaxID=2593676 RepID=UPI000AF17BA4|nr:MULTISPECIES: DUF6221 family protein [unclassified Streptomyces]MDX3262603.1 DUF6221 family protein [Streptomyces sp. MI02-2A]